MSSPPSVARDLDTEIDSARDSLAEACLDQLTYAFGLHNRTWANGLLRPIFGRAVRRFAGLMRQIDSEFGEYGTAGGSALLVDRFCAGREATGIENIPADGPLMIVANHPGAYDAAALASFVERDDLKFIVRDVSALRQLPNIREIAVFTPKGKNSYRRIRPARECIRQLKNGGALLIFPRGRFEPDPDSMENPDIGLNKWSPILQLLANSVPETKILTTVVGGVISPKALRHPITWFRSAPKRKQRLAFMYQLMRQALSGREVFGLRPRVTFGEIVVAGEHKDVMAAVEAAMRRTMALHLARPRTPVAAVESGDRPSTAHL
jgi:hypothetical protein